MNFNLQFHDKFPLTPNIFLLLLNSFSLNFLQEEGDIQMNPTPHNSLNQFLGLFIIISITLISCFLCSSLDETHYANCKQPFKCGDPSILGQLKYPFWGVNREKYCGAPESEIKCLNNTPFVEISTYYFRVVGTNPQSEKFTVAIPDFWDNLCPSVVLSHNHNNASILELSSISSYLVSSIRLLTIFYGCPSELRHQLSWSGDYSCSINRNRLDVHFVTDNVNVSLASGCLGVVVLPILQHIAQALDDNTMTLPEALNQGFEVGFGTDDSQCNTCMGSGGQCGYDWSKKQLTYYCPDKPYPDECPQSKQGHYRMTIRVTGGIIGVVVVIALLGGCLIFTRSSNLPYIIQKCAPIPKNQGVEDCLKNYASLVPKRYTYTNIKKITKSFKEKLGEGGYGAVFKGSLQDGRYVAVKVWKQSQGDGQEFVNEVMSMSRTSHVNVVSLLGFCFEGHKWALIYEYMPNGSLEKFLHGRDFDQNNQSLSAQKLFEIALGIARGLEYLHRGCNTRIVHFDIKPHNILLDAEFTPKISDFGLAKSLKQEESIILMSGARGTAGYIAPEVFFRTYGGVSHKSDVYSFGMMVLEMVGCKKRVDDQNVENSSEMYFPHRIYKQLEQGTSSILNCGTMLNEEKKELERKMILVGLWCIQTNPLSRPTMSRVVEMLEGKVELLEVPPMPTLASPPRQEQPTDDDSASFFSSIILART